MDENETVASSGVTETGQQNTDELEFVPVPAESEAAEETSAAPAAEKKDHRTEKKKNPSAAKKPEKKTGGRKKKGNRTLNWVLTSILTLLLIVLAVLVFVFRDALTGEGLRRTFGRENSVMPAREAFTYETGAEQVFAPAGDGLAVASSSSVQLLDSRGQTVFKQVVSFETPAVFACGDRALFCDLSGTVCISAGADGESISLSSGGKDRKILTAGMNGSGWFTLVTAEPGYKALVSVYNAVCEKQYEWWSGTGYVLRAAVGPDNKTLAVLCAEKTGTVLHFFALNSETEQASAEFPDVLLYDMYYMNEGTLCLVGETGLYYVSPDGTVKNRYLAADSYLLDYEFSPNFITLFVSSYRGGGGGTLLTLDGKGTVLGTRTLERDVVSLSAAGKQLLVMTGDSLVLYDQALVRQYANETLMTAKKAILRPAGDILLLSAYSAERFSF